MINTQLLLLLLCTQYKTYKPRRPRPTSYSHQLIYQDPHQHKAKQEDPNYHIALESKQEKRFKLKHSLLRMKPFFLFSFCYRYGDVGWGFIYLTKFCFGESVKILMWLEESFVHHKQNTEEIITSAAAHPTVIPTIFPTCFLSPFEEPLPVETNEEC